MPALVVYVSKLKGNFGGQELLRPASTIVHDVNATELHSIAKFKEIQSLLLEAVNKDVKRQGWTATEICITDWKHMVE